MRRSSGSRSRCCGQRAGWSPSPLTPLRSDPSRPRPRAYRRPPPPPERDRDPAASAAAQRHAALCPTPRSQGGAPGGCEQSASPPSLPGNPLSSGGRSAAPSPEVPAVVRGGRLRAQPPAPPCRPRLPHCPRSPGSGPATRAGVAATGGPSALLRPRAQQQQQQQRGVGACRAPPPAPVYGDPPRQATAQPLARARGSRRGSPTPDPPLRPLGGPPQRPAV